MHLSCPNTDECRKRTELWIDTHTKLWTSSARRDVEAPYGSITIYSYIDKLIVLRHLHYARIVSYRNCGAECARDRIKRGFDRDIRSTR